MKGLVCDWILGCLLAAPSIDPNGAEILNPRDLEFRSILYQVYQRHDEQALVEALVIEDLAPGAPQDRVRYQIAQLSTAFDIGASNIALDVAAKLDAESLGPQDRIRVAVLCARDAHRRQDWSRLERELSLIDAARHELVRPDPLPPEIASNIVFMRAELATAQGDFGRADGIIRSEIPERDSARAFALFNLGVALRNGGLPSPAEQAFNTLATMRVYSQDALDLKERALVALSLINQQRTASATAEAYLRQIPVHSRYHDQALVAYANTAMEHGDYELAARVWYSLLQESKWSSAGKTAQLGYPIALENAGKPRIALGQYRLAETDFAQRQEKLGSLAARLQTVDWNKRLIRALAKLPDDDVSNDPTFQIWRDGLGHDDWFAWLTSDAVQVLLQDLRELDRITTWLTETPLPAKGAAPDLERNRKALAVRVSRLVDDHEQKLNTAMAAIVNNEQLIADRQLRLIRVGIARTMDRVAEESPTAPP